MIKFLLGMLFAIVLVVIGWHIIFPLIGGAIIVTSAVWFAIVGSIVAFCIVVLLAFIFTTGLGIFILGLIFFIWTVLAIILFPVVFPIVLPLLIIYFIIAFFRRKKTHEQK